MEARLRFQQGYNRQAFEAAEAGFHDSSGSQELNWKFRVLLAEAKIRQGHPAEAAELVAPLPPAEASAETLWRRKLTQTMASCLLKDFAQAEAYFAEAEQLTALDEKRRAELTYYRGRCEVARGGESDLHEAQEHFRQVANSSSAVDGYVRAWSLANMGTCATRLHHSDDAIAWYLKARDAFHALDASPLEEQMLGWTGYLYFEAGDIEKAGQSSSEAAELAGKLGLLEDQSIRLLDMGRVYMARRQFALAEQTYKKSLELAKEQRYDTIAARCLHNLVQMKLSQEDLASAVRYHEEDEKLRLKGDDLRDLKSDDADLAAARGDWRNAEKLYFELLPETKGNSRLTWDLQGKLARVSAALGKVRQADQWYQRSIATMEDAAASMQRTEFRIATLDTWPVFGDYIAFLESQGQPERALQVAQIARARMLAEELGFKPKQESASAWVARIKAMLRKKNAVILAYYEATRETYLWAITSRHLKSFKLGVSQNELETLAETYQHEVQDHLPKDQSLAQQKLYQLLIKPARNLVPKGTHVILVADSALYRINLESLISDEGTPHYWIDDAVVESASSIDLLLAGQHQHRNGKEVLLIGAPVKTANFPLLPHALEEIESVKKNFPRVEATIFSGPAATPEAYKSSNPGRFRYIEFAAHGTASPSNPLRSSIALSPEPDGSFQLYADDIIKVKLNADLVTISACYGAGKFATSAEGLLGLQWAFMRAGAHQVVAGLWDIDDASAPMLMGGLYAGVVRGQSAAAALRAAKLKMLHSGGKLSAPYYWAPLQVYTGP